MFKDQRRRRRYGVTPALIAAANERRAAGDVIGACAAAGIEAAVDLRAAAEVIGAEAAARLADDLRHLVPDLLRWHVLRLQHHSARYNSVVYLTRNVVPLAEYGERALYLAPVSDGGPFSVRSVSAAGPSRFVLRFGRPPTPAHPVSLSGLRELWDARAAPSLLARCGGHTRLPFFAPDGTRHEGTGPEAVAERAWRLFEQGRLEEGWREAGVDLDLDDSVPAWHGTLARIEYPAATALPAAAWRAASRVRTDAAWARGGPNQVLWFDRLDPSASVRPRLRIVDAERLRDTSAVELPLTEQWYPEDFHDLVTSRIAPHELHPLVAAALFPSLPAAAVTGPPPMPPLPSPRVRCTGDAWHQMHFAAGTLTGPHPPADIDRESALYALGGPEPTGCPGAYLAWRGAQARLPKRLRDTRRELMSRVAAGESDTLEAMLDAGLDPHCRDGDGRTLLHLLACLVPDDSALRLLPRLLAAGLDPHTADRHGRTAVATAERAGASPALIAALIAALGP